jgi:hypothetical protein
MSRSHILVYLDNCDRLHPTSQFVNALLTDVVNALLCRHSVLGLRELGARRGKGCSGSGVGTEQFTVAICNCDPGVNLLSGGSSS